MDVFKTRVGDSSSVPISEENYHELTSKQPPYCKTNKDGRESYYAVCPRCDNPIQIVGMYKKESDSSNIYAKHRTKEIAGLAQYDEEAYLACPYSKPSLKHLNKKRKPTNPTSVALYNIMKEYFDCIVYIWNTTTGIKMSYPLAKAMLQQWIVNENWLNYSSSYQNLAYMLFFSRPARNLYGLWIRKKSGVYDALLQRKNIILVDKNYGDREPIYAQIEAPKGAFLDLTFGLTAHKRTVVDHHLIESFTLRIHDAGKTIYSEKIEVQSDFLNRLIHADNSTKRDKILLEIALEIMD